MSVTKFESRDDKVEFSTAPGFGLRCVFVEPKNLIGATIKNFMPKDTMDDPDVFCCYELEYVKDPKNPAFSYVFNSILAGNFELVLEVLEDDSKPFRKICFICDPLSS